jgi:membrane associated rhomboid family serine protease
VGVDSQIAAVTLERLALQYFGSLLATRTTAKLFANGSFDPIFFRRPSLTKHLYPIGILLLAMWLVRIVDIIFPGDFNQLGIQPRTLRGLPGIILMPFLHGSFGHLISNTIPLVILLGLTVASRHNPWPVVAAIVLGGGVMLWLLGRNASHVGASGLVFGLIAYLITVGIREKQIPSLAVAVLVGILFGTTLISGVIPRLGSEVSWDGHLFGAISGMLVGIATAEPGAIT